MISYAGVIYRLHGDFIDNLTSKNQKKFKKMILKKTAKINRWFDLRFSLAYDFAFKTPKTVKIFPLRGLLSV
jgi:hypothetical protein